jgi:hypothetical protein
MTVGTCFRIEMCRRLLAQYWIHAAASNTAMQTLTWEPSNSATSKVACRTAVSMGASYFSRMIGRAADNVSELAKHIRILAATVRRSF